MKRLRATPTPIVEQCTRGLAQSVVSVLSAHKIPSRLVPLRRAKQRTVTRDGLLRLVRPPIRSLKYFYNDLSPSARVVIPTLLVIAGLVLVVLRSPQDTVADVRLPRHVDGHRTALSSREVIFAAMQSSATIRSPTAEGIGFFIGKEQLITSAQFVGRLKSEVEVLLTDGRLLSATVVRSDPWLDCALVEVPGAEASALELGDATGLERGETIMAVSNAQTADFTASLGIVSHTSRIELGISYFEIDAGFGGSGGPVLDSFARVVGIVTSARTGSSSLRLALPINYLYSGDENLLRREPDSTVGGRWHEILARAAKEEKQQLEGVRLSLQRPTLVSAAGKSPDGIMAVVGQFAVNPPSREQLAFDIERDGARLCSVSSAFTDWKVRSRTSGDYSDRRMLKWLDRHGIAARFYTATNHVPSYGCPENLREATLIVKSGDSRADRVIIQ